MKRILIVLMLAIIPVLEISGGFKRELTEEEKMLLEEKKWKESWEGQWDDLLYALIEVESHGDPNAVGSCGDRGILQITPILIQEVNRLGGSFTHEDAWDEEKSKEMFYIIARHYCPEHDFEKMARIWNGGPRGPYKSCTRSYWNKVQKQLI